jgi:hypothetical protein
MGLRSTHRDENRYRQLTLEDNAAEVLSCMSEKNCRLSIGFSVLVAGGAALVALAGVQRESRPGAQPPQPTIFNLSASEDEFEKWATYRFGTMRFKYPSGWKVVPQLYRTPPEEAAGKPAYPIGLTIFPSSESATSRRSILIGGHQANCESFLPPCKCFTIYEAIYTCADEHEIRRTFSLLLKTVRNDDPNAAFLIDFPAAQDRLKPNKHYTIRWTTKSGLRIRSVSIFAYDTSKPSWRDGLALEVKNVPNTGRYDWLVLDSIESPGPYLLDISFVKPIQATPSALRAGRIYEAKSDPFYIY